MKEKIERLSKGIFEYEMPYLIVSEDELNVSIEAGSKKSGSICIGNAQNQKMKGVLYVTGKVLSLDRHDFIGTESVITYLVDASTLQPGEEHVGTISIVSDCGEYSLPFNIRVTEPSFESSIGMIRDLFQFTNLARVNWTEAQTLFGSPDFAKVVLRKEPKYKVAYEQLIQGTDLSRALEEFLVLVHKKKACEFFVQTKQIELETGEDRVMENITVQREQWGYVKVSISTDAPYLQLTTEQLTSGDFVNGQAEIGFLVETEKLRRGNYFTEIVFTDGRKTLRVPVVIHHRREKDASSLFLKGMHRLEYRLTELYLNFRNNVITNAAFLAESARIAESILRALNKQEMESADTAEKAYIEDKRFMYELYQAYLGIVDGRGRTGEEAYQRVLNRKSYFERNYQRFYCAVLYLETMKHRDAALIEEYTEIIRRSYEREEKDDLLLWFLLYMDKRLETNHNLRYETIKKHCADRAASPVLLYEAATLWNAEPTLVTKVDAFECQVMKYLVRTKAIRKETALQFVYLVDKCSEQYYLQIAVLKQLYDKFEQKDMLGALCRKLIQIDCRSRKNHKYFRQAVREQLSIAKLQDYYLFTLDKSSGEQLEQQALLSFSYGNFESEEDAAFVYSYVVRNKDSNPTIYRAFLKKMEQFAVNQMKAGVISEYHAVLYADVLRNSIIDREMAQMLPNLIFTYQLECKNPAMRSVCVAHKEERTEKILPLIEEEGIRYALVPIYTENAEVFLVDAEGRRYIMSPEDKLYRLMHAENFLDTCYEMGSDNRKLLLHTWEKSKNYNKHDARMIELQKQLSDMEELRDEIRNSCVMALTEYYYDNYNVELLESYLNAVNLSLLTTRDREHMLEMMILRDMYDKVIESVEMFGCSTTMQAKKISRLCVRGICSPREEKDRSTLLTMGMFAFKNGRVEDRLLQYLADRYNGTTGEMYELWCAAREREMDTKSLEERLLAQMLFAESYVENSFSVFVSYLAGGMNRKLIRAYYSYCANKYFVWERTTPDEFFEMLKKESFLDGNQVCVLALLKYYAGVQSLSEADKSFVSYYIQKFVQKKLIFAFFKEFEGKVALPSCLLDKYYVEYHANPKHKLTIHYSCCMEESELRKEAMVDMDYGIFVKELILFYGESLQYFITEETEDGIEIVESRIVRYSETKELSTATKYGKINEILLTQDLQDEKTLFDLLEQYCKEEYAVKRHFSPV